jgi:plastocyanin
MRRQQAILVIMAVLAGAGCGGGSSPSDPPPTQEFGTVRGTVRAGGQAIPGATLQLSRGGTQPRSATSGGDGVYQFTQVAPGTWSIGISPPSGFAVMGASSATVAVAANQVATADFQLESGPPQAGLIEISVQDNLFSPADVTIQVNTTVRWRNAGYVEHNSTGANGAWASANMAPGASFDRTFDATGTFNYSCTLHPGMNGIIRVQE